MLGAAGERVEGGIQRSLIGPLRTAGGKLSAHFAEAIFPPGMRTRVHAHPGPEAFYVVDCVQCMETPVEKRLLPAGSAYVVEDGPHL